MSFAEPTNDVVADPHTARTLGVLNIVYALGLMCGGLCVNLIFMSPTLFSYVAVKVGEDQAAREAKRQATIEKLVEQEKSAADEDAKKEFREAREEMESSPDFNPFKGSFLTDARFRDPRIMGYFVFDMLSGILLNLLMLISGIGIYGLKRWGRYLGFFVAFSKILRLALLAVLSTLVIAPVMSEFVTAIETALPEKGIPSVASQVAGMMVASSWIVMLLGSIYPLITILCLKRASVRESFRLGRGGY